MDSGALLKLSNVNHVWRRIEKGRKGVTAAHQAESGGAVVSPMLSLLSANKNEM